MLRMTEHLSKDQEEAFAQLVRDRYDGNAGRALARAIECLLMVEGTRRPGGDVLDAVNTVRAKVQSIREQNRSALDDLRRTSERLREHNARQEAKLRTPPSSEQE